MNLDGLIEKRSRLGAVYYENSNGDTLFKVCTKCNELKSVDLFNKNKQGVGNRSSHCKECIAANSKKYYRENIEKIKQNYSNKRDYHLEQRKKWYRDNIQKIKQYRIENKEKRKIIMRDWRLKNKEHVQLYGKKYAKENLDKRVLFEQRRRARMKCLPSTLTIEQQEEILKFFKGCAFTGSREDITWDHVIPLSTGHGGTIYENMIPLISSLNSSKNNSNIFNWFESNRQRFNLKQEKFNTLIGWLSSANGMTVEEYRDYVFFCHEHPVDIKEGNC